MIPLSVAEAAEVVGAELIGPGDSGAVLRGITADSRQVAEGWLFVALLGEHVDGHAYVEGASRQGAAAALTTRPVPGAQCLVVVDPLVALGRLARHLVELGRAGGLQVVGVTGSQGKTSTKDLLAQVLEAAGPTVAPVGNLNNELGVPLTISRVEPQTRFLVAEMGARGIGHIAYLCEIAAPTVGVVLNVGHAHVGEFGGQAAIAKAKGELVEALPGHGWAVLNAQDPLVWPMRDRTEAQVLAFGVEVEVEGAAVWASGLTSDTLGRYAFRLQAAGIGPAQAPVEVQLQGLGHHQVLNAVAAAAAAVALGLGLADIAAALSSAGPRSRWRMELRERPDGVLVVNDSYNANPDSMRAALSATAELGRARTGTTWAVLGDMLELGADAPGQHASLGESVVEAGIDRLVALGEFGPLIAEAARAAGLASAVAVSDKTAAVRLVVDALGADDVVLVKASRGLALDTVADEILTSAPPPTGAGS